MAWLGTLAAKVGVWALEWVLTYVASELAKEWHEYLDNKVFDDKLKKATDKVHKAVTPEEQEAADAELENLLNSRR